MYRLNTFFDTSQSGTITATHFSLIASDNTPGAEQFSARNRDVQRSGWILVAGMIFCIITAGCIGTYEHNPAVPMTPVPDYNKTPVSGPTLTQTVSNETYWIHFDPLENKSLGSIIWINGTTNLNVGEEILIQVYPADFDPRFKLQCGERNLYGTLTGTISVHEGSQKNLHIFDIDFNSSVSDREGRLALKPQEYTALARAVMKDAEDKRNFTLMPSDFSVNATYTARGCG